MGCGCGGSKRAGQAGSQQQQGENVNAAARREGLRGPRAPGYYWNGPQTRAAKPDDPPQQQ